MSLTRFSLKLSAVAALAVLSFSGAAHAASGTWNGTQDAYWTNSANWSASPFPSGGDTATFNNAGGAATTIDIDGLSAGILNLTFDTAGVAAYVIGTASTQTNILRDSGEIKLSSTAGSSQAFDALVRLGPDATTASYSLRNDSAAQTLTFADIAGMSGGTKTLSLNGVGPIAVNGRLDRTGSALDVNYNSSGAWTLNGDSSLRLLYINATNGVINLGAGTTMTLNNGGGSGILASQDCTVNGPGLLFMSTGGGNNHIDNGVTTGKTVTINAKVTGATGFEYWQVAAYNYGTFVLTAENDYTLSTVINVPGTIQFATLANRGVACNLGAGTNIVLNSTGALYRYTGTGDTSDRIIEVQAGGIIEQAGSGNLNFTAQTIANAGTKTLVLRGSTAGTGEFSGGVMNSLGTVALTKDGSGTWTLSAANSFSGATAVLDGTLALSGNGTALSSASFTVSNNATLRLSNTAAANNTDRLRDASPITLAGGTLSFFHDDSAANYAEACGALAVNANASTVSVTPAPAGYSNIVRFASLTRTGSGTVNFAGTGLGESDRCRVFITGQAAGLIGQWATVNGGGLAAYDPAKGVYDAEGDFASIAARGPSVIADNAAIGAEIDTDGTNGPITLEGAWTNSTLFVRQNTSTAAEIATRDGTTNKTLLTSGILISADKADVTVGQATGDGFLAPLAAGGTLLLQNDNAAAQLTVNAPVVNNASASGIAKNGAGKALLTSSNSFSGATAIQEGTLAFGGSVTQTLAGLISGNGTLAHEGSGRLALTAANTYTGPTVISGGMVLASNNAALGTGAAGTVISDGATLDIGGSATDQGMNINAEQITVSGPGVNGRGAIINGSIRSQYNALRLVTLAGDTVFGGEVNSARWDIRNTSGNGSFVMNDHSVAKVGSNQVGFTTVMVTPGGPSASIDVQEGSFTFEAGTNMGGDSNNVVTVQGGAYFDIYEMTTPVLWSLVLNDNARFYARQGNNTRNFWNGPVTLNGWTRLEANTGYYATFGGPVSGPGQMVKLGAGTIAFTNPANSYAGTTIISNGTLYVKHPGSLPGYNDGRVTVANNTTLATHASDGTFGFTAENVRDLNAASTFLSDTAWLNLDLSLAPMTIPYDLTNRMGLIKQGTNTLTLSGLQRNRGDYRMYAGELVFNGTGNHEIGMLLTQNASVIMTNDTQMYINVTNKSCYIADNAGNSSTWLIGGKTAWSAYLPGVGQGQAMLVIGQRGRAALTLKDDAMVTNAFRLGNEASGSGAIYQFGNTVYHNWGGQGSDSKIGVSGYGYYELNSGTLTNNGYTQIGCNYAGVGILKQTGGAFKMGTVFNGQFAISRGGTGVVYTAGGTFNTANQINIGEASDYGVIRGYGELTADGDAVVNINGNINMADRTNMCAILNFNGGRVAANLISKSSSRTGSVAYVNFDGGTFRSRIAGNIFNTGVNAPDAVTLYDEGATFDTTNLDCAVRSPLLAPVGSGVSEITITPRGGYIGPPMVNIFGGGGTGATAIAQFDSASGAVNGITVTCPGFGYTSAPTVTLTGGGTNIHNAAAASLAANVSGGITKLGSGALTLYATNTYAGVTTVSNGTLRLGVAEALPAGTDLNIAGGLLELGGFTVTNGDIVVSAGGIAKGALVSDSFTKVGAGTMTLAVPVSSATPIAIEDGIMRIMGSQPGLLEAPVNGTFNTSEAMSTSIVTRLTTRMANTVYTEPYNVTWIYKGYLWNRAATNETWTFAENFYDNVYLLIDSTLLMTNGIAWNMPTINSITLSPGPHAFEARFGQGGGGGGPVNGNSTTPKSWWTTTTFGFGVDFLGRHETNIANFVALTDPGNGNLLTTAAYAEDPLSVDTSISIAEGALLDLDGNTQTLADLSGSGMVSNGTLTVTGTLAPGGETTVGDLTLACDITLTGTLLVDIGAAGASDSLIALGDLTLSGTSTLEVANPGLLDITKTYTVAEASGAGQITGDIEWTNPPNSHWTLKKAPDGSLKLLYVSGTVLMLR